jgi:hypothetical protein
MPHRQLTRSPLSAALAAAVVLVAFMLGAPRASAYLYWTDNGPGLHSTGTTIGRANMDSSGVVSQLVSNAAGPGGLVSDGAHIYWANSGGGGFSIGRAGIDGTGANPAFISGTATAGGVYGVTTDGTYLYWTDGNRYVGRANLDGSGANGHFIDMGSGSYPLGIALSGGRLYVGEFSQIVTVASTGGTPSVLTGLSGQSVLGVAVANGYVYFTENLLGNPSPNGRIGRVLANGLSLDEAYVSGLQYPTGVVTDGNELYWVDTTNGEIGRATIGAGGATGIEPAFILDSGGPEGIALDSAVDATSTAVTCNPSSVAVGSVTACTAVVSDSASSSAPTGSVTFASAGSSYFSGGNTCTLTARPGGGAACTVAAASATSGTQTLSAAYAGDPVHAASGGQGSFCAGTATTCGGASAGGGGPSGGGSGGGGTTSGGKAPTCKVPKLKGRSLAAARKLLVRAHCRLGKVFKPNAGKGRKLRPLVVSSARPGAGRVLANGAKIELWLVQTPMHRRR